MRIASKITIGIAMVLLLSSPVVFAQQESGQAITGAGTVEPAGRILTESVPSHIINKSDNYIKSLVGNDYFDKWLTLTGNKSLQSGTGEMYYNVFYLYNIQSDYLASPTPKYVSVSLDKDGNIIDYLGPKKTHTFLTTRGHVIEIAKQNGVEPVVAEIDRVLATNSIDGYVWVVTGAVDETTCRYIGGAQECLIPGLYVDVDDGSVIGTFNSSNLIREPSQSPIANTQANNNIFVVITVIIILFSIILLLLYNKIKIKYMEIKNDRKK